MALAILGNPDQIGNLVPLFSATVENALHPATRNRHWPVLAAVLALLPAGAAVAQTKPDPGKLQWSELMASATTARAQVYPGHAPTFNKERGNALVQFFREGEWYFSWGYSKQFWAPNDIHVSQPSQGNDFNIHDVHGHDEPGGLLNGDLFGPQYSFRIGRFVNDARTIAIEVSFDHTKYTVTDGQIANVTGLVGGVQTNANFKLDSSFFAYKLHNGANHLMANAVYRYPLIGKVNETYSVAAIGKVGAGLMVPHTSDTIMGRDNDVGPKSFGNLIGVNSGWWRFNGWTAGVEFGLRAVLYKPFYIELTDKIAYARLSNLPAYQGTLDHSLLLNSVILSVGYTYDGASKYGAH
jgi:hypothetical protein